MSDWVVESPSFEEDLMNNRCIMLNQNGVNKVVEIIKAKDQEIEILVKDDETSQQTIINQRQHIEKLDNKIYKIYQKALDTSITSIDLRDYIISSLGSGKDD